MTTTGRRGLLIRPPWARLVAQGAKTLEIRRRDTAIRGRIWICETGSRLVVGSAHLDDTYGPMTPEAMWSFNGGHHLLPVETLRAYAANRPLYAWAFTKPATITPRRFVHPPGAQTWISDLEFTE